MAMSASVPRMIARGRFVCGSFTSPAANDRSAKPSYAHSTLTSARPIAPIADRRAGAGSSGARRSRRDAPPSSERRADEHDQRRELRRTSRRRRSPRRGWRRAMLTRGGEGDRARREAARGHVVLDRIDAEAAQEILAEDDGDAAERGRADQHELRPAEAESRPCGPSLRADTRRSRRSPAARRRARASDSAPQSVIDAAERPIARASASGLGTFLRDAGRRPEDSRSDRDADDERDRAPQPERARQPGGRRRRCDAASGAEGYHA